MSTPPIITPVTDWEYQNAKQENQQARDEVPVVLAEIQDFLAEMRKVREDIKQSRFPVSGSATRQRRTA